MSHDWIDRRRRTICRIHSTDAAFVAINVALFLPFGCNKQRQMAASPGTKGR
jgi:hypothetical protein